MWKNEFGGRAQTIHLIVCTTAQENCRANYFIDRTNTTLTHTHELCQYEVCIGFILKHCAIYRTLIDLDGMKNNGIKYDLVCVVLQ